MLAGAAAHDQQVIALGSATRLHQRQDWAQAEAHRLTREQSSFQDARGKVAWRPGGNRQKDPQVTSLRHAPQEERAVLAAALEQGSIRLQAGQAADPRSPRAYVVEAGDREVTEVARTAARQRIASRAAELPSRDQTVETESQEGSEP